MHKTLDEIRQNFLPSFNNTLVVNIFGRCHSSSLAQILPLDVLLFPQMTF